MLLAIFPLLEIGAERPAGRIGFDRPMAVALDVAQHDIDVVGRANSFRGRTTVTVGKRRNHFVREPGGHAVGESDDRTARSAGLLVQLPAGGTGAVIAVLGIGVVLTDRPIKGVGLLAHPVAEVFDDRLQHVRVGQAQLRAKVTVGLHADPFAVDQGVIFRMFRKIPVGRQQLRERMHPHAPVGFHVIEHANPHRTDRRPLRKRRSGRG